ncbi:MAG TPA: peptidylprolyl isomerase [Verrucomicrobiae bacterium]|nr:peptidylprolyl isomerase [Verrucomicrobiae bacterium]
MNPSPMTKLCAPPARISSAVTHHRFCRFGDLSPKQGRVQRPGRVGRLPAFDGDKSPAESADKSAHSKVVADLPRWVFLRLFLPGAAGLIVLAGCGRSPAPDPTVLAKIGDRVIHIADVEREIAWRQNARRGVPEPRALLEEMITQESLVQKARAAGLEKDPEFQRACRSLLVSKFKERELTPRVEALQVSAEELRAAYEKQKDRRTQPGKARLALVQIKTDLTISEPRLAELRTRIEEARAESLALTDGTQGFGKVAVAYSEDQASRYKGGDVGWFDEGQTHYRWPAEVIAAGFALKNNGNVSEVIRAANGLYLVKKLDTRAASVTPLAQVEEGLRRQLLKEKREQAEKLFLSEARRAAGVQTFSEALASRPVPSTTVARRTTAEPPGLP